jgi:GNAT superfamily N-acetyltransferase
VTIEPVLRRGEPDDLVDVMRLFDGALLETDSERINRQLARKGGYILCAYVDDRPVGAIGLLTAVAGPEIPITTTSRPKPVHITAIAVRNSRQNRGIGRTLVEEAADRAAPRPLSATFDERVRPFYTACGFEIERQKGRLWGVRPVVVV